MKLRCSTFICLLLCAASIAIQARQISYNFCSIGVSNGLPDNYVKNVFGLPDGRLGVRTSVLLNLYDGTNFSTFPLWTNNNYPISYHSIVPTQYIDSNNCLWLKERGLLQVFDLSKECFIPADSILVRWGLREKLANLFVDSRRYVWLVDVKTNIFRYDTSKEELTLVCEADDFLRDNGGPVAVEVFGNACWMVHESGIIRCYDIEKRKFVRMENFLKKRLDRNGQVVIRMLENGDFWLMWTQGLGYYDSNGNTWNEIKDISPDEAGDLVSIDTDKSGNLWLGTARRGLYTIERYTLSVSNIGTVSARQDEINGLNIHSVYVDKQTSIIWIGLFNQGLACYHPSMNNFRLYNHENVSGEWSSENVHCMLEQEDGTLLLGTQKGLCRYNPKTRFMDMPFKEMRHQLFHTICRDSKGCIWIGSYQEGLYCIENGKVHRYLTVNRDGVENTNVRAVLEDRQGRIWVSVNGGVGVLHRQADTLELLSRKYPELKKYKLANTLALDADGRLVVGTDNGLYIYDRQNDSLWVPELEEPESPLLTQGSNKYNCLFKDSRNLLWMGTQYGIKILSEDKRVDFLGLEQGFANATVQSIQEDNNHDIWVATVNAIYKIEVESADDKYVYKLICLDKNQTHDWNDLYDFCALTTRNGQIVFGKMNGFCMFTPENIVFSSCINRPLFTSFKLFNEPVVCGREYGGRVLFDKAIDHTASIVLRYDENFLTFGFSSLNFVNPAQTYFRYKLEGLEKQWTEFVSDNGLGSVTYNSIPPGEYVFKVQSAGNDREWSPESVFTVVIRPPFWNTLWAKALYLLGGLGVLYGFTVYLYRRNKRKLLQMQELEAVKQKEELNQMKFRFFTNVSHELRTPLTLIIIPLEILRKKLTDEKVLHQLDVVYKNAQELYGLVNQLLDFRKVEMQMEKLRLTPGDMEEFLTSVHTLFMPFAADKYLDFKFRVVDKRMFMYFDHDKLHKIVNNLLSNAFKFTPKGGAVTLQLSKQTVENRNYAKIEVTDTGIGIPEEQLPHIFERFYQVQNWDESKIGSGIGLHLVREYIQIHEGRIEVGSRQGEGTTFTVYLPMDLKPVEVETAQAEMLADKELEEVAGVLADADGKKKILIVEDNDDVRTFLKEQLEEWYNVLDAPDGEVGERLAIEHNPDLIVSDIMMPKVDGIELCRRIKTSVQTSHIPVVLLTARTADDIKISSYEVGADSYIAKPFNFDILLVRIRKLIEQQESRRQEFRKNIRVNPSVITITSLDEQLMQKALERIERNIDNPEYNVETLSRDLGMSRMNLYRKLQAITGHTPTEFIKTIRLKRAAQLLQGSQLTMVEVADRVGFSSSSYFTKCFKEQFGVLPTQYAENEEYWGVTKR